MATTFSTPGVYVNEVNAFANSVVPVATAVPAFIGYTPRADYLGKSFYNKPQKISSFAEFQTFFMLPDPPAPADPARQYSPEYYLVAQPKAPSVGNYMTIGDRCYSILPDPDTIYYLYNSVRLFYQNGGGDAYIVAVGTYGPASKKSLVDPTVRPVNANVKLSDLQNGVALLVDEHEPTIYLCPEATLLAPADNATLMQSMLDQANTMQTVVCLFDVIGGAAPDPIEYVQDIQNFRNSTGSTGLKYGVCYYPFIGTTIMQATDIDFTNLFGGDTRQLANFLNPPAAPNAAAGQILAQIQTPSTPPLSNSQLQAALLIASPLYRQIVTLVLECANVQPPSGAMAGVYTANDNTNGVWSSPANTSIVGAVSLPIRLTNSQQENLNVDALSGKSINAIRFFNGRGILVWGARTLDGNSEDWRYLAVCRTMTFVGQFVKMAAREYVFAPNDPNTWSGVKSVISSFLMDLWKQGGLQGASASDAFQVSIGLGSTMTPDDVLNGYLRITVMLAIVKPDQFIVLTFQQQQAKSG